VRRVRVRVVGPGSESNSSASSNCEGGSEEKELSIPTTCWLLTGVAFKHEGEVKVHLLPKCQSPELNTVKRYYRLVTYLNGFYESPFFNHRLSWSERQKSDNTN
jgi:hypothetical protein